MQNARRNVPPADAPAAPPPPRAPSTPASRTPSTRLPPMHALEAFEAAARLGTFSQAAASLFVTQSAISHRIRQLEESLGARLFVRVHKQVVLTPQGETFLAGVREAMQHVAAAAAGVRAGPARKLRVTASPAVASVILLPRLQEFLAREPDLDIEIQTSERLDDLTEQRFDVGLRLGTGTWPGLASRRLLEERVGAYASPSYVARFGARRSLQMLAEADLIRCRAFSWSQWLRATRGPADATARAAGLRFHEQRAAIDAAIHGLGVVLSNRLTSIEARRAGRLVPFVSETVDVHRHYFAAWRADGEQRDVVGTLVDWLATAFDDAFRDEPG